MKQEVAEVVSLIEYTTVCCLLLLLGQRWPECRKHLSLHKNTSRDSEQVHVSYKMQPHQGSDMSYILPKQKPSDQL